MAQRRVQLPDSIGSLQDDLGLCDFFDGDDLDDVFFPCIRHLIEAMDGKLSDEALEEFILRGLAEAVESMGHLRRHVQSLELPWGWTQDQTNWDNTYRAAAACLLDAYYRTVG
jgi:hypothetical protein